jgi:hypothetical protein
VNTLQKRILLGLAGVAVLALLMFWKKQNRRTEQPTALPPVNARVFAVDEWLDSCLKGCRRRAPGRLSQLPADKRERYCTVNCECGMEKMTEPAGAPRTVRAPSKSWLRLSEDDQFKAARDCQTRANGEIGL